MEQITMFPMPKSNKSNKRRKWGNAFQKWSNDSYINDGTTSYGACGFGSMCEWCKDNDYGRPCVRALNAMCREKGIEINYEDCSEDYFVEVWDGEIK